MDEYAAAGTFCISRASSRGGNGCGGGGGTGTKCGRWNPTSEQVKVLTELFRSGLRTPSTDQIQKISSQLSFYGKIESKNVFYWFQNHKARERQKRRRVQHVLVDEDHQEIHRDQQVLNVSNSNSNVHYNMTKLSSTKNFGHETNHQVSEQQRERVIQTLQLFPLNSNLNESDSEKFRLFTDDHCGKENSSSSSTFTHNSAHHELMDRPTSLDLRLSFV